MTVGEKIRQRRKVLGLSVEFLAKELGISRATLYRYEDSSIEKIPANTLEKLCKLLQMSPTQLMGWKEEPKKEEELPVNFATPSEALAFILKMPTLAAYGGYNIEEMDDETLVEFANEILQQIKLVSYKYK